MAEGDSEQDKTEEPTPRRLSKAREQGDVPTSREAGNLTAILSLFVITAFLLPFIAPPLAATMRGVFETAGQVTIGEGRQGIADAGGVVRALSRGIGLTMAPVLVTMILAALAGVALQGPTVVAAERLKPKMSKINPLSGLKRLFSISNLVEFAKSLVKVLVVGFIAIWVTRDAVEKLWQVQGVLPEALPEFARQEAMRMLVIVLVLVATVAVTDAVWKRVEWMRKQRMTRQEVRDEMKDTEGDPHIRAKRAGLRRQRAQQRMAQAVPRATVILTNPTHYAVALRYEQGVDEAPVCVAKGADLMAAQIRRLARDSEIPVVENRPLARALFDVAEIDEQIPVEHWEAVAAIIAFVLDMRRNVRRPPPPGSSLRAED